MDRSEVLSKAAELISGDRQATYGDAKEMHQLIGDLWSAYLGVEVGAVDVAVTHGAHEGREIQGAAEALR